MDELPFGVSDDVARALERDAAVVALESTVFSTLGLPEPHNREALRRCTEAIRAAGAVPALTAVLDGVCRVGIEQPERERVLAGTAKVAERDLAVAAAQCWPVGVTTVSATLALAERAGISVFATGGIGGVHRDAARSGDVSADLDALANHPVITVCAGAKAFLDAPRTLEYLETLGVPVLGWQHDEFPAFYSRSSGVAVPHRVFGAGEVARVLRFRARPRLGVLLAVPIPPEHELDPAELNEHLTRATADSKAAGVSGAAVTPDVLSRLDSSTGGRSVRANLALAEHNARVAAEVAVRSAE